MQLYFLLNSGELGGDFMTNKTLMVQLWDQACELLFDKKYPISTVSDVKVF